MYAIRSYYVAAAMLTEALLQKLMNKRITVSDGSAALTGLLLALNSYNFV